MRWKKWQYVDLPVVVPETVLDICAQHGAQKGTGNNGRKKYSAKIIKFLVRYKSSV